MNISKITVDSSTHALRPYGECATAAATAAKVVTCTDFTELYSGATILVNFTSANTASAPTLDVNGTGAKSVVLSGSIPVTALSGLCEFVYNGTGWVVLSTGRVAALDTNGKISSSVLPSYVDDVIEGFYNPADKLFYKEAKFTNKISGEKNKVYVDVTNNTGDVYRYSGTAFIKITSSPDHTHSISLTANVGSSTNGTTSVATGGHTHTITFNSFNPTGTTDTDSANTVSVSTSAHTHPVSVNGNTGDNTASVDIPTSDHTHTVTAIGTIGAPIKGTADGDQVTKVASSTHTHVFSGKSKSVPASAATADVAAFGHVHTFTGEEGTVPASSSGTTVASSTHTHTGSTTSSAKATNGTDVITASASAGVLTITAPHTHATSTSSISGTASVAAKAHTHLFTPSGTIATTTTAKVVASLGNHTHSYTPEGTIAAPTPDTAANFTNVASTVHTHLFTGSSVTSSKPSATDTAAAVTHKHSISIGTSATANTTKVATVSTAAHTHTFTGTAVTPSIKTQSVSGTVNVPSTAHKHEVTVSGNTGSSTDN